MADSGEIRISHNIPSDLLDDIASRFLLDASDAVLNDPISLCFKTEQAYWFYLDEYVEEDKSLKAMKLDMFAVQLLMHVKIQPPNGGSLENMLQEFREFKMKVPTYGGIMLNDELSHVLLALGYCPKDSWGFPKGKINVGEKPHKCAIREVLEETGYDISNLIDPNIFIESTIGERLVRLYIVDGVPLDTIFMPKTKGEIKELKWFHLGLLPSNKTEKGLAHVKMLYMAMPFVKPLRDWVNKELKLKNSTSNKKKRPRRRKLKSLSGGDSQHENNSTIVSSDSTKKTMFADKAELEVLSRHLHNTPNAEESKKFSFKQRPDRPQSQPTHDTENGRPNTGYFSSEIWRTFKIDQKAVNSVLDDFFLQSRL